MNAFSAPSRRNGLPKRRAETELHDLARVLMRNPLPHTQGQPINRVEPLEERQAADPAVFVRDRRMDRRHAARRGELQPFAHGRQCLALAVRRLDELLAEEPRRLLAQDARRLAVLVDLDDAAVDAQVAVGVRERRGVQPHRVPVARGQRGRDVAGDRVEDLPRRLDRRRPVAAPPAAAAQPASGRHRATAAAHALDRLLQRPGPSKRTSCCASAHATKCTCESVKPGSTQRPPRSTISGDASAVSCVPTPPAILSPAIASARAIGSEGSSVRMTPFSRITSVENLARDVGPREDPRVRLAPRRGASTSSCSALGYDVTHAGDTRRVERLRHRAGERRKPVTRNLHVAFVAPSREARRRVVARQGVDAGYETTASRRAAAVPRGRTTARSCSIRTATAPRRSTTESAPRRRRHRPPVDRRRRPRRDEALLRDDRAGRRHPDRAPRRRALSRRGGGSLFGARRTTATRDENVHLAFRRARQRDGREFHRAAVAAGYRDNGPPGERAVYHAGYYGAFVLDPDGNNVEAVCHNRG